MLAQIHAKRVVVQVGNVIPLKGIKVKVVSADGALLSTPLAGEGEPNPSCKESEPRPADQTENARSVGVLIRFGRLKVLDQGDLTCDKELQLTCPANKVGKWISTSSRTTASRMLVAIAHLCTVSRLE